MKVGTSVRTSSNTCLFCHKESDAATVVAVEGAVHPEPGDVTICMYCGHIMAFNESLQFRELNDDEIKDVAGDPRIVAISKARTKVWKAKS